MQTKRNLGARGVRLGARISQMGARSNYMRLFAEADDRFVSQEERWRDRGSRDAIAGHLLTDPDDQVAQHQRAEAVGGQPA